MSYSTIDPSIQAWIRKHGFTLFERTAGIKDSDLRAVYLSRAKGECFQIWIDKPSAGHVELHAADIETENDEEFREDWRVPVADIGTALEQAFVHVHKWMNR